MAETEPAAALAVRATTAEAGPVARLLSVEVSAERVGRAFDRAYRDLARRAQVKGFRPGKVPRSVLERLYGPAVAEDVERSLVSETLARGARSRPGSCPWPSPRSTRGRPRRAPASATRRASR